MRREQYHLMQTEIAKPEYNGMDVTAILANWLSVSQIPDPSIRISEIGLYDKLGPVIAETILQKLKTASETPALSPLDKIVGRALRWLEPNQGGVAPGNVNTIALIDNLVSVGVLASDEATALKNLGLIPQTKAESLGFGGITLDDVQAVKDQNESRFS